MVGRPVLMEPGASLVAEGLLPGHVPVPTGDAPVDAHHHLWDPARRAYPWMDQRLAPFQRRFGPEQTWTRPPGRTGSARRSSCRRSPASRRPRSSWPCRDRRTRRGRGRLGRPDSCRRRRRRRRAAAAPGGEVLVGIRHQVHDEPDPAWLLHGEVLAGLAAVAEAGPAYDLLVRERELLAAPGGGRAASEARLRP